MSADLDLALRLADGMKRPKRLKMAKPAALAMAEASLIPLD